MFPTWKNYSDPTCTFKAFPWDWDVSVEAIEKLKAIPKETRKKLIASEAGDWNVYGIAKGQNWYAPISGENHAYSIMAFAADYDLPMDFAHVESACRQRAKLGLVCPKFIETSLSNNFRCIWTFERPVLVPDNKFGNMFLSQLCESLEAENFLPGFDRASTQVNMRWTNGGYWTEMSDEMAKPLSAAFLTGLAVRISNRLSAARADLPFDRLEALLVKKYPRFEKFNGGRLKMRANGLRFWEDNADNPNGAYVIDKGFFCVTGARPVITWEELLGKGVVDELRATNYGVIAKDIFYDGKKYFVKSRDSFVDLERGDAMLAIAAFGFERSRQKGEVTSPAEQVLLYIQKENRVDGAAPLLFSHPGVVEYQNRTILNISRAKPLPPAQKKDVSEDDFPFLHSFFSSFFAHAELRPKDYFFAWWRRFYQGALEFRPVNGQAVFICGPRGCGKNLISELILPMSMGGSAPNPYRYLMGDTSFSDDIFSAPVLAINDEDAPPDAKKSIFEQKVKSLVANNEHSFHPKFMKSTRIEWCGRLIGTLNDGPKDVGLLPMLNPNTVDKLMYFLAQAHDHKFFDKHKNREIVAQELPFFLRWLLEIYVPPVDIVRHDRFGVESFHDPFLVRINRQEQLSYNLLELLAAWMSGSTWNNGSPKWKGTPTELLRAMTGDESLENILKNWEPNRLSKALGDLARSRTPGVDFDPDSKGRTYVISKEGVMATVQGRTEQPEETQEVMASLAEGEE